MRFGWSSRREGRNDSFGRRASDALFQRLEDHIEETKRNNERFEVALIKHDQAQTRMHEENKEAQRAMTRSIRKLEIIYYMVSAIVVLIGITFTAPGSKLVRFFFDGTP